MITFRISKVSVWMITLLFFVLFAPASQVFGIEESEKLMKIIAKCMTYRNYFDCLVTNGPNDPTNPIKPTAEDAQANVTVQLWEGEETRAWSDELEKKVKTAIQDQLNKTKKSIIDSLNLCYKALEAATKKGKPVDQDKAMTAAIVKLNQAYKKQLSSLPSDLQSAADSALKICAKTDKSLGKRKFIVTLSVGNVSLPPAPGFWSKLFSSGRDRSKEHNGALDKISQFKQEIVEPNPTGFPMYVGFMWNHNVYPFILNKEINCICLKLPVDITEAQFSEASNKIRSLMYTELGKFDSTTTSSYNNKLRAVFCDPKKGIDQYNKLSLGVETSLQKEQSTLKSKLANSIDKIVIDYLSTIPAYKGSAKLRNYGLDREDMTFATGLSDNSQIISNDKVSIADPTIATWTIYLNNLKDTVEDIPTMVTDAVNKSDEFATKMDEFLTSIDSLESVTPKTIKTRELTAMSQSCDRAMKSLETSINVLTSQVLDMELYLASIERKAGKDKSVMAQVNGVYAIIEYIQKVIRSLEQLRLGVSEDSMMFNTSGLYNGDYLKSYLHKSGFAISDAIHKLAANPQSIDVSVINNSISAVIDNISKFHF
ncbi:MAG: hypothetical protein HQM08_28025 [Candidatus Riflebacteria bacterium]|nr:hypothetical protein [Candidatus Riflebacteria bacterium]